MTIPRVVLILAGLATFGNAQSQTRSAADTGAPQVAISHSGSTWKLAGQKNSVEFNQSTFSLAVHAAGAVWNMAPAPAAEMLVAAGGDQFRVRLADASHVTVTPYETGFKSGIRIVLEGFRNTGLRSSGSPVDLRVVFSVCLETGAEDLIVEAMVNERGGAAVQELNWPPPVNGREVDYTVISSDNGTLLPRDWPKWYHPILRSANEHSVIQSHLIESWSMSWWGFLKGSSGMMVIVETPDDAAYTFGHPAGGPTSMGPSWRAQLGHFGYPRRLRMAFLSGNYVALAKRYRSYVMDSGLFVPLKDKMAQRPVVGNLIGTPFAGASVLRNKKPGSANYDAKNPAANRRLATFAQNVERLRDFKVRGFEHLNVSVSGWLTEGYDRQTPDALPPAPEAGGWQGMKALFDACRELGYTCWLHDQYRDYYLDAPSWNPEFAVHEQDATSPPKAFPGTRFKHDWKDGYIPLMDNWDGGTQGYLNNDFMLGHVIKNYTAMFAHGIHPQGSYQDVFGYIPPDEDFNPDHPSTRTDSMNARISVFHWVARHLGIVGTEDASDWVVPFVDYATDRFNRGANTGTDPDHQDAIPVPLYELVYHDALVTSASPNNLRSFLHGNAPQMGYGRTDVNLDEARRLAALHRRVGLLEMVTHEFLDPGRQRERTTFADGTTVTVDWPTNRVEIKPDVAPPAGPK